MHRPAWVRNNLFHAAIIPQISEFTKLFITFLCRLSQLFGEICKKHYFCNIKTIKKDERKSMLTTPVQHVSDRLLCKTREAG